MLGITLTAFAVRTALHPVLQPYGVFHFFIVASLLVQYLFGYRMALISVGVSLALGEIYFVEPYGEISHLTDKDFIISLNFVMVILPAIFLVEKLQRSLYTRQLLGKVNVSRMTLALRRENDRLYISKKIQRTEALHGNLMRHFDRLLWCNKRGQDLMPGPAFVRMLGEACINPGQMERLFGQDDWSLISGNGSIPHGGQFKVELNLPLSTKTLKGSVLRFEIEDQPVDCWLLDADEKT